MKLKHLEAALSNLNASFPTPQIQLEQYPTSAHLAAAVALAAHARGDLFPGCSVCDLGCGTGMLSLSCALLVSSLLEDQSNGEYDENEKEGDDDVTERLVQVVGVDICKEALIRANENAEILMELELLDDAVVDFMHAGLNYVPKVNIKGDGLSCRSGKQERYIKNGNGRKGKKMRNKKSPSGNCDDVLEKADNILNKQDFPTSFHNYDDNLPFKSRSFDTVLTNPPFGTKNNEGIDMAFLAAGCRLARGSVYSFHKSSTRHHLLKKIRRDWKDVDVEVVAQMKFDIPNMYKFHKTKSVDVDVDLIRVWHLKAVNTLRLDIDGDVEDTT